MMEIRIAEKEGFDSIRAFYHSLIDAMEGSRYTPGWEKGIYPSNDYLRDSVNKGQLYICMMDGLMASAMILNHECNEGYQNVKWLVEAEPETVTVVHALGVHPDFGGNGLGKAMVSHALSAAGKNCQKAVRLDGLCGNIPAERLYTSMGFRYIDTIKMFYEDTGWTDYKLFEYPVPSQVY